MFDNKEIVERIRTFCKENGTSITKLEAELGWSNGYIGKWAKARKKPPIEKLSIIANRLNVLIKNWSPQIKKNQRKCQLTLIVSRLAFLCMKN